MTKGNNQTRPTPNERQQQAYKSYTKGAAPKINKEERERAKSNDDLSLHP